MHAGVMLRQSKIRALLATKLPPALSGMEQLSCWIRAYTNIYAFLIIGQYLCHVVIT